MANLIILPPAAKYLKKLKDKRLKKLYQDAIDDICADPSVGDPKHGDLEGVLGYDIYYNKINCPALYQHFADFQRLFTGIRLRENQFVDVNAEILCIYRIDCIFRVYESTSAALFLTFRDCMKRKRRFT